MQEEWDEKLSQIVKEQEAEQMQLAKQGKSNQVSKTPHK